MYICDQVDFVKELYGRGKIFGEIYSSTQQILSIQNIVVQEQAGHSWDLKQEQ
jgi:hypothetical protein